MVFIRFQYHLQKHFVVLAAVEPVVDITIMQAPIATHRFMFILMDLQDLSVGLLQGPNKQWGFTDLINTGSAGAFYFPVAFKNNCLITLTSPVGYAVNTNGGYIVGGNTSSAAVELFNWGPISAACKIIALGK